MNTLTKILIVEHDPSDIELLQYELKKGGVNFVSEVVQNEQEYERALEKFIPDIILSDYSLPSFDGYNAFKIKEQTAPNTPFIIVSGNIGEENSINLIKNGVTDYVLKDNLLTLTIKLKRALIEAEEKKQKIKADQELRLSERRLARAQKVAKMGSWELDFATNMVFWSDEACRIYDLLPDQNHLSFDSWLAFIHPDDLDFVSNKIKESKDSLRNFSFHHRIVHKNESIRHIYSESKLEFDPNGKAIGLYGVVHDVTEKKLAEIQIEFDRNNLNALINNTSDLMWSMDREFKLITFNQPFDDIDRLTSNKTISNGNYSLAAGFPPERLIHYKKFYERAFAGETFTEIEYTDTPSEMWSEISFYPMRKGDEVIGTACHSRNITERKKGELKLEQQNEALIKANTELDRFVYSASHDLRSPLSSVLGLVYIIEKESKESNTVRVAKMIGSSINRLDGFIKNIVNYSQNNRTEIEVDQIPIQQTINEIMDSLRKTYKLDGINFEVNIEEQHPFYSDKLRFVIILENMISNAIKWQKTHQPGKYIKITGKSDKDFLSLSIEDKV